MTKRRVSSLVGIGLSFVTGGVIAWHHFGKLKASVSHFDVDIRQVSG